MVNKRASGTNTISPFTENVISPFPKINVEGTSRGQVFYYFAIPHMNKLDLNDVTDCNLTIKSQLAELVVNTFQVKVR